MARSAAGSAQAELAALVPLESPASAEPFARLPQEAASMW
jgi:hypothetical protein